MTSIADSAAPPADPPAPARAARLPALDVWRGLIMVFMALDHANVFMGSHPQPEGMSLGRGVPPLPRFTSDLAWWSRFVTHFCAPGFVFLAGASIVLMAAARRARGVSPWAISGHFVLRGVLLIVIEFTLVAWGWGNGGGFQVIGCLGACLILGAVFRLLPAWLLATLGFLLLFGHPLLADVQHVSLWTGHPHLRVLLFVPGVAALGMPWGTERVFVLYPILPWFAVCLLGMATGHLLVRRGERGLRWFVPLGLVCVLVWLVLRLTDGLADQVSAWTGDAVERIGNLTPRRPGRGFGDARGFFHMSKYPPAADFILWNVGVGLLFCAAVAQRGLAGMRACAPLRWLGRAPLFFYVAHLWVYRCWIAPLVTKALGLPDHESTTALTGWPLGLVLLVPATWAYGWLKRRFPGFPLDLL